VVLVVLSDGDDDAYGVDLVAVWRVEVIHEKYMK
jgi:hypothetical protein